MKLVMPNYDECITNLSNSILKHFNIKTNHNTIRDLDNLLDKNYKNVIVILCDGMGSILLDEMLTEDSFLIKNRIKTITSVYPPTTTAATTSMLSALNPNEHGWLGWDLYFKEENKTVSMFINTIKDSNVIAEEYSVANKTFPYKNIISKIGSKYESYGILSFENDDYKIFNNQINKIIDLCKIDSKKFIYAYYEDPDHLLHDFGINNPLVKKEFENINKSIEYLCDNIDDSIVIVTADHGHINTTYYDLDEYPNIKNLLERTISIEPRATSFKIIESKKEEFIEEFNKCFKDEFWLLDANEVIDKKIFGTGINNIHFKESIGDFVALAKSNKGFIYSKLTPQFISHHAGLTDREMLIPLIVKEKKLTK